MQYHAVYKENEKQKFVENLGVVIMNVMIKQSYIAITERSQVAMCKGFMIPEEIKQAAPKRQGNLPWISKLVLHSPVKTDRSKRQNNQGKRTVQWHIVPVRLCTTFFISVV